MVRKIFIILLIALGATACGSTTNMWSADSSSQKLELGMNKSEVIQIMGKYYASVGSSVESGVTIEVLGYEAPSDGIYKIYLHDGKVVKWEKTWLIKRHPDSTNKND